MTGHLETARRHSTRRASMTRGLTTLEALCVASVAASTLGLASGSWSSMAQRHRLQAAATMIEAEVQLAKSWATANNRTARLEVQHARHGSWIIVHAGEKGACRNADDGSTQCATGTPLVSARFHDTSTGVRLANPSLSLAFSASRGTVTPTSTIRLTGDDGSGLNQVVNLMGRVRTCSLPAAWGSHTSCRTPG